MRLASLTLNPPFALPPTAVSAMSSSQRVTAVVYDMDCAPARECFVLFSSHAIQRFQDENRRYFLCWQFQAVEPRHTHPQPAASRGGQNARQRHDEVSVGEGKRRHGSRRKQGMYVYPHI